MQFIRLSKLIEIAERELPELDADWMNTKSLQNYNISFVKTLWVNMLITWVIECLTSWMPHWRSSRNFTHQAWAKWDLRNHDLFWIILDPGRQKRITSSLESISTMPFEAGTSYVKIPEWRQHCSKRGMPCLVHLLGNFRGTWNQPKGNRGALFRCPADIFSNISKCEIQRPGMLIAWKIGEVSVVGCTNDWQNRSSSRMLIDPRFRLLAKWSSLIKVVCWLKRMPRIPLFWLLLMLVVQSSCFAIYFPPCIFHSNYLSMSPRLCWIRGTWQIRRLGVYCFFVRSIFRWWRTSYIVYG